MGVVTRAAVTRATEPFSLSVLGINRNDGTDRSSAIDTTNCRSGCWRAAPEAALEKLLWMPEIGEAALGATDRDSEVQHWQLL